MVDRALQAYVVASLPPAPARVLEVGAGNGDLAAKLRSAGYDVVAIDPASDGGDVQPVALHEVDEPDGSFDSAVAVLSMHHVEPLEESCQRLGALVRPGGRLVLDELDVARFDERAARWWLEHGGEETEHGEHREHPASPVGILEYLRHHCHELDVVLRALGEWFELGEPVRGAYLYRWELGPELRSPEEEEIADGGLPATGARVVGVRR
jgi:SAM-dependent methyltransferase